MTWRPPIKDPVSIEADDDRERCTLCGKPKNRDDEKGCHCEEDLDDIF